MTDTTFALNTISGRVAEINKDMLTHPAFRDQLVEVPEGTKSYAPDLWTVQTADEYREAHKAKAATPDANKDGK